MFLLLDENNIIRCIASEECNLHKDKLYMKKIKTKKSGFIVGDEFNPETEEVVKKPENYPQPSESDINEKKVADEIRRIAVSNLILSGELPEGYV